MAVDKICSVFISNVVCALGDGNCTNHQIHFDETTRCVSFLFTFFTLGCVTFLHTFILMMEHSTVVIVGNVLVILLTFASQCCGAFTR